MKKWNEINAVREMWQAIANYEYGWDGGVAQAIPPANIEYGLKLLDQLQIPYVSHPMVRARSNGAIEFFWDSNGVQCTVGFHPVQETRFGMAGEDFTMPREQTEEFVAKAQPLLRKLIIESMIKENLDRSSG